MVIYLCGGINGLSDADCRDWREAAKSMLYAETLDPMRRDYRGIEAEYYTEIVAGDLADIRNSDVVLVNATRPSWGTAMEVFYAHSIGKPVIAWVGQDASKCSPWLREHCEQIYAFFEDAITAVNALVKGLAHGRARVEPTCSSAARAAMLFRIFRQGGNRGMSE